MEMANRKSLILKGMNGKNAETEININEITNTRKQKSESEWIVSVKVNELEQLVMFETYEEVNDYGQKLYQQDWSSQIRMGRPRPD